MNTQPQDMLKQARCSAATLEAVRELLPDVVLEIAELIGMDATKKLIKHLGGVDFRVPLGQYESAREKLLVWAVGRDAAEVMMSHFGGERLYIPRCDAAFRQLRNMQFITVIDIEMDKGMSQTAAIQKHAPLFGFSERQAYIILKQALTVSQSQQISLLGDSSLEQ